MLIFVEKPNFVPPKKALVEQHSVMGGEEQLAGDPSAQFKDVPLLIMVGVNDTLIATPRRIDEQLKSENIAHEYKEMPGLDHGGIIMGGMPDVFKFFGQHTKP